MKIKISPSMMCADITKTAEVIRELEINGVELLHIDIMDGCFVPNFTLGTDYCRQLKKLTDIPLDIHLMIEKPEEKLCWFDFGEGDMVSVHAESTAHLQKALAQIRSRGAEAFVALNPATGIDTVKYIENDIDGVLVMAVNPGFAGQKLVPSALDKIKDLRRYFDENGFENKRIEVDGNVSFENSVKMYRSGADIFVVGTSSVFTKDLSLTEGLERFRRGLEDLQ